MPVLSHRVSCLSTNSAGQCQFTTAAVDNLDHTPSATTAKDSLYGTPDFCTVDTGWCCGVGCDDVPSIIHQFTLSLWARVWNRQKLFNIWQLMKCLHV